MFGIHYAAVRYLVIAGLLGALTGLGGRRRYCSQASLRTITGILHGVPRIDPESVIQPGILILIATPIVRVALHRRVTARTDWK
jgi:uncharacterized membrane protein